MTPVRHTYLQTHKLRGRVLSLNLASEEATLITRARAAKAGRAAKTLVKQRGMRVVLTALTRGTSLAPHAVAGPIAVQILNGSVMFETPAGGLELGKGAFVALDRNVEHTALALKDSSMLITMAMQ
jgi:quercetin dioxygenase-like cupin family protein